MNQSSRHPYFIKQLYPSTMVGTPVIGFPYVVWVEENGVFSLSTC